MNNQKSKLKKNSKYDLEERTAFFGEKVIKFARKINSDYINKSLINQLIRSSGSIGANYCEANEAESKKDFAHKIGICKKETKETKHWLRLLITSNPELREEIEVLNDEAHELLLIFSKIISTCRSNLTLKLNDN